MNRIWIIALANIKNRKLQSFLIGLCIMLSFILLSATLVVMKEMQGPFDKMYENQKASQILLIYNVQKYASIQIFSWFADRKEVESVSMAKPVHTLSQPLIYKEKEIDLTVQLTEFNPNDIEQDLLIIAHGAKQSKPGIGEIWIPQHLSESNNIKLNDTIGVPVVNGVYPLTVGAIVMDPLYPSPLFNPTRSWVSPGALPMMFPVFDLNERSLGIRVKKEYDYKALLQEFTDEFNFEDQVLTYDLIKSVFLSFYSLISSVLLIFSILALFTAIFLVYSTLSNSIRKDIRSIGVLRTIGLIPRDIIMVYVVQSLIIGFAILPVAYLISILTAKSILSSLFNSLGLSDFNPKFTIVFLITTSVFILWILITSFLSSKKAFGISILSALREELMNRRGYKVGFSDQLTTSLKSLFLGIKFFFYNFKRTLYTGLSLLLFIFILFFSLNVSHSFSKLKDNKTQWGLEDADLIIRRNKGIALPLEHEEFQRSLGNYEEISLVIPFDYSTGSIILNADENVLKINGKIYSDHVQLTGLDNLDGNHPQRSDEISLCMGTALDAGIELGDSISFLVDGSVNDFVVSGLYQDISNLGQGFRMHETSMRLINPLFKPNHYLVKLEDEVSSVEFKGKLLNNYGETIAVELSVDQRKGIQSTLSSIRLSFLLIVMFFVLILLIILINDTVISVLENKKTFGILKSIGLTPDQLKYAVVIKSLILTLICLVIGIPMAMTLSPIIMDFVGQGLGLRDFPFLIDLAGSILIVPATLLFIAIAVWFTSSRLTRISSRNLINS